MKRSKRSFTLAEVLVVLAIIGIVASITIPSLMNKFQDQELKTRFLKAYSEASQAWRAVIADSPDTYTDRGGWECTWPDGTTADYDANDGRTEALMAKMKIIKTCEDVKGCWPDDYEFYTILGNDKDGDSSPYTYSWITADGMCWSAPFHGTDDASLLLDTNCSKPPNKIGEDIFSLLLGKDGVIYSAFDDSDVAAKPVSSGAVCPWAWGNIVNDRSVNMKKWLMQ